MKIIVTAQIITMILLSSIIILPDISYVGFTDVIVA